MKDAYTLTITTAHTVRFSRPLVEALEPREVKHYFAPEVTPGLIVLRRSFVPTGYALNSLTQYIGSRMLAYRMIDHGFQIGVRYHVTMSGDSEILACRNTNPEGYTHADTRIVSVEERRERQARLLQMIHGNAS